MAIISNNIRDMFIVLIHVQHQSKESSNVWRGFELSAQVVKCYVINNRIILPFGNLLLHHQKVVFCGEFWIGDKPIAAFQVSIE